LFDLAKDPGELNDLAGTKEGQAKAVQLERLLRAICDPEAVDRQAKADQRAKAEFWGGDEAIRQEGLLVITPAPGTAAQIEKVQ
jgi:choline-sulfatase